MEERVDSCLIAIRRIIQSTENYEKELSKHLCVTPVQLRVLQIIAEANWATATNIAKRMGVSQATITALVDKLVMKGLVDRKPAEHDRRKTDIIINAKGKKVLADAPVALQQRFVENFNSLPAWEQTQLIASLERVAFMMDEGLFDASPVLARGGLNENSKPIAATG